MSESRKASGFAIKTMTEITGGAMLALRTSRASLAPGQDSADSNSAVNPAP